MNNSNFSKYISSIVFLFFLSLMLFVLTTDKFHINEVVKIEDYTFTRDIAYCSMEKEANTNRFGGVESYTEYVKFGIVETDGSVCSYEDWYNIDINLTTEPRSYVLYNAQKKHYQDGSSRDIVLGHSIYLTECDLKNLK